MYKAITDSNAGGRCDNVCVWKIWKNFCLTDVVLTGEDGAEILEMKIFGECIAGLNRAKIFKSEIVEKEPH